MHKNNPNNISEKELDKLLNQSFLETELSKPENEKIIESIAISTLKNSSRQSATKKLIGRISLQAILIACLVISGGIIGIVLVRNTSEEPEKANTASPEIHEETNVVTNSKTNETQKTNSTQNSSTSSRTDMYKKSAAENNSSARSAYNDSTPNNFTTPQLEALHFNDPEIILPKTKDTASLSSKHIEENNSNHDKIIKKRAKIKWREHEVKNKADHVH